MAHKKVVGKFGASLAAVPEGGSFGLAPALRDLTDN